jgi:hypothetical protein
MKTEPGTCALCGRARNEWGLCPRCDAHDSSAHLMMEKEARIEEEMRKLNESKRVRGVIHAVATALVIALLIWWAVGLAALPVILWRWAMGW